MQGLQYGDPMDSFVGLQKFPGISAFLSAEGIQFLGIIAFLGASCTTIVGITAFLSAPWNAIAECRGLHGHNARQGCCTALSFLSLVFLVYQGETLKLIKDFFPLPNPRKPWKNQRKHRNNQGNSLLKINQGIPKKPRKGRPGWCSLVRDGHGSRSLKVPLSRPLVRCA